MGKGTPRPVNDLATGDVAASEKTARALTRRPPLAPGRFAALLAVLVALCGLLVAGPALAVDPASRYSKDKIKKTLPPSSEIKEQPAVNPAAVKEVSPAPAKKSPAKKDAPADKKPAKAAAPADLAPAEEASAPAVISSPAAEVIAPIKSPADFNECVRVALSQSPLLMKSSLEIETKRLDVGDAISQFLPTVAVNVTYYMRTPPLSDPNKPYTISFSTGAWNPVLTMFEVQAKREMVNIAILSHLQVIDKGLKRLGVDFLQLSLLKDNLDVIKEKEDVARQYLDYAKTRASIDQGTELDVRIAESRLAVVKAEEDKIKTTRGMITDDMKFVLGVPFIQKVDFELADGRRQVIGDFNPADVTDEKLRNHSFDLKMQEYEKALQKKNIALSYVRFMPSFNFGFQTVDAINSVSAKDTSGFPFYPYVTFSMPLDWWTKARDVSRQYKKLGQLNSETKTKEFNLMSDFQQALAKLRTANSDVNYAQTNVELSHLRTQQAQYRFESGQADFSEIVNAMDEYLGAKQQLLLKKLDRDIAMLELRYLSGDMQDRYINVAVRENM